VFCEWAAEEPPDPVKLAHIRSRSTGPPAYPPLAAQAGTLAHALWDWAVSGFKMASDEEVSRRLAICAGCPMWVADAHRCSICGCNTDAKVRLKTARCPLDPPRW
jgi:hypothetical protein